MTNPVDLAEPNVLNEYKFVQSILKLSYPDGSGYGENRFQ